MKIAQNQLESSEKTSNRGGRGHARQRHAGVSVNELQKLAQDEDQTVTAYLTKEDQVRALASPFRSLRKDLSPGGSLRGIQQAKGVNTDRFRILIATKTGVRQGWSSSMTIIRRPDVSDNNIITAYPIIERSVGKKNPKMPKNRAKQIETKRSSTTKIQGKSPSKNSKAKKNSTKSPTIKKRNHNKKVLITKNCHKNT